VGGGGGGGECGGSQPHADSKLKFNKWDPDKFDLVFIDGGHGYDIVRANQLLHCF
jgi:hypothetical protein